MKLCSKSRKCGKHDSHLGKCDQKRRKELKTNLFWERSPLQLKNAMRVEFEEEAGALEAKKRRLEESRERAMEELSLLETAKSEVGRFIAVRSLYSSSRFSRSYYKTTRWSVGM